MDEQDRLKAIGFFLSSRREQISPAVVGLASTLSNRRRAIGLRREEVAALAGISADWYTRIEQGRAKPSRQTMEAIARVYSLTQVEQEYLFTLAGILPPLARMEQEEQVDDGLQRVLDHQKEAPAYILGCRWDTLAWNLVSCAVFCNFNAMSLRERNIIRLLFTNPKVTLLSPKATELRIHDLLKHWQKHALETIWQLRAEYARNTDDPSFVEFIEEIKKESSQFRKWWNRPDEIGRESQRNKTLMHPEFGRLFLEQTSYQVLSNPHLKIILYMPSDQQTLTKLQRIYEQALQLSNEQASLSGRSPA